MSPEENNEVSPAGIDPAFWRGLTSQRISRRSVFGLLGAGAATVALASGGVDVPAAGAATAVGSAAWWKQQKLHHTVNFANWPYYIDVLKGHHLSLDHFTKTTKISVNYSEAVEDNSSFYAKIRPSLAAGQATGYDIIVMTDNSPELGYLRQLGWLTPLNKSARPNFDKYASALAKNPSWDPGNAHSMPWQSGWTTVGYNAARVKSPGDSIGLLFSKKHAGRVGMFADPIELGAMGLLAIGVDPAHSTEKEWAKAATKLLQQRSDGIVAAYYDQSYIQHLKNGDIDISMVYSGDIFQANLNSKYKNLVMMTPKEGMLLWTDNMCIPVHAANPLDAMELMDYFYSPVTQSVVEYYDNYICPVPAASAQLVHPTGWNASALSQMRSEVGLNPSVIAKSTDIFPSATQQHLSHGYYRFTSQEEITAWNNLFLPITQGA